MLARRTFRVLLVASDPVNAHTITKLLGSGSSEGFQVRAVPRLSAAIAMLSRNATDVILLELDLPDATGLDAVDRLHSITDSTPIIVLSDFREEQTAQRAVFRGAHDYLVQDRFDERLLRQTIHRAVERRPSDTWLCRILSEWGGEAALVVHDGLIRLASARVEELLGYPHGELCGRPLSKLLHAGDFPLLADRPPQILQDAVSPDPHEAQFLTSTGAVRWFQVSTSRIGWSGEMASLHLLTDITGLKAEREHAARLLRRQEAIGKLSLALGIALNEDDAFRVLYEHVKDLLNVDGFVVSRLDVGTRKIRTGFVAMQDSEQDPTAYSLTSLEGEGQSALHRVIQSKRAMYIPDCVDAIPRTPSYHTLSDCPATMDEHIQSCGKSRDTVRSVLLAPMLFRDDVIGVLQVWCGRPSAFQDADLDLLSGMANIAAIAVGNSQLTEELQAQAAQLRSVIEGVVHTVSAAAETRDLYTSGHQRRVSRLAVSIAETLELDVQVIDGVRIAGLLHDIGKLGIPLEILVKPGALSSTEMGIMKSHPGTAFRILQSIAFPWPIAEIVHQHHERLDGSGYPRGLMDDEILLEARIIGVADVVEAMASHRPYRPALGLDCALAEIKAHRNSKFDSRVVDACVELLTTRGFSLDSEDLT